MSYPIPRPQNYRTRTGRSDAGLGLYAVDAIPAGRFIIEYWGAVVPDDEAQRVGGKYLFDLENGRHILGGTRQNTARYANHSCVPNSEIRVVGNRVYIWSIEAIPTGEEITYDYGEEYFDQIIKPMGCRCKKHARHRKK